MTAHRRRPLIRFHGGLDQTEVLWINPAAQDRMAQHRQADAQAALFEGSDA